MNLTPALIPPEFVIRGQSWVVSLTTEQNGSPVDLSPVPRSVRLRVGVSADGLSAIFTRTKGVPGETYFPDLAGGVDGRVDFLFSSADTLNSLFVAGKWYDIEFVFTDTSTTPQTKTVWARGSVFVVGPNTGPI